MKDNKSEGVTVETWLTEIGLEEEAKAYSTLLSKQKYRLVKDILDAPPTEEQLEKYGIEAGRDRNLILQRLQVLISKGVQVNTLGYEHLKNLDVSKTKEFINPPDKISFFTEPTPSFTKPLYIRECYPQLYDLILQHHKEKLQGLMLFGNPGIGKSWFLNYLIIRLIKDGKVVLMESFSRSQMWLFKDGQITTADRSSEKARDLFRVIQNNKEAFYLYDPSGPYSDEPRRGTLAFTVMTSSPNRDGVYKQFLREALIEEMFIPCYDYEELKLAVKEDEYFDIKYKFIDGSPRNFNYSGQDIYSRVNEAIESISLDELIMSEKIIDFPVSTNQKRPHMILKYKVDKEFRKKGMEFVTSFIARRLFHKKYLKEFVKARSDILFNRGDRNWKLFQNVVQNLILTVGGEYEIYCNQEASNHKMIKLDPIPLNIPTVATLSQLTEGSAYCPSDDYHPVGDLVLMQQKYLVFINATVAKSHGIATKIKEYKKFAQEKGKEFILAWAIPEYMKEKFKPTNDTEVDQIIMLISMEEKDEKWIKWTENTDTEWDNARIAIEKIPRSTSWMYTQEKTA